ncbi:MAG: hypothetical protein U5K00_12265 [Melioribacteraceae bacterium]|nr:hypothetical protein [Melioribacteraceae bacterium]
MKIIPQPFTIKMVQGKCTFSDTLIVKGTVPLTVGWLTSVKYFVMQASFDPDKVRPDTLIAASEDLGVYSYSVRDNILSITWYNNEPIDLHGKLFDVRFTYSDMMDPDEWVDSTTWSINQFTNKPFVFATDPRTPTVTLDPANFQ